MVEWLPVSILMSIEKMRAVRDAIKATIILFQMYQ